MSKRPHFSIILPTYSGLETISGTLDSVISQHITEPFEVVIVIDGRNTQLEEICALKKHQLISGGIPTRIIQFQENRGRFIARLEGARSAKSTRILFLDDRVELSGNYLKTLLEIGFPVIMPNVEEVGERSRPISLTLNLLRKKIYGPTWGASFVDYYIDAQNFEKSPKGTAALWISRDLFLRACETVAIEQGRSKYTSDDTKVLKEVIQSGSRIMRTSRLVIFYHPRTNFWSELKHLYGRGPLFVDYYMKPGTRFFAPLIAAYIGLVIFAIFAVLRPHVFTFILCAIVILNLLFAAYLANFGRKTLAAFIGLFVILGAFGLGLLKGLILKVVPRRRREI